MKQRHFLSLLFAMLGLAAISLALWQLNGSRSGVATRALDIGHIPATVFTPASGQRGPAIVIAHGFAGSRQLMHSFAIALARNGYSAIAFDFAGHGRNPAPLTGNITQEDGATRTLVAETVKVLEAARELGDGRVGLLGHSMASDIVVRAAQAQPDVAATVAVSMFSPAVTAQTPRNLLIVVGDWEGMLKQEALRAVGLAVPQETVRAGITYGRFEDGSARRAAFVPSAEHVSVLFRTPGLEESVAWFDQAFATPRNAPIVVPSRGGWIALLFAGIALLMQPLSLLLPRVAQPPLGANLAWRQLWLPLLLPAILTPLLLRVLPTHFLPVLVADYLAAHFATYGVLTALVLRAIRTPPSRASAHPGFSTDRTAFALATTALMAFYGVAVFWPLDTFFASFKPGPARIPLALVMFVGTLSYFFADEWLTRGAAAARGRVAASKVLFLISLALAVALDFERLFFLVIIIPAILIFFGFFALVSGWTYRQTGHPWVAGTANAAALAIALAVTFPLVSG